MAKLDADKNLLRTRVTFYIGLDELEKLILEAYDFPGDVQEVDWAYDGDGVTVDIRIEH